MGAMAVAIGYALKAQPLRCFPLCKWVLRPISWAERTARRLQAPFPSIPSPFYPLPWPLAASFPPPPIPVSPLPISIFRIQSPFSPLPVSGRVTSG